MAVSPDNAVAWVTLQEQNAVAVVDLTTDSITEVVSLGVVDSMDPRYGFDASDRDGAVRVLRWPVYRLFQPDTVASLEIEGTTYYLTANEGDVRDDDWAWYEDARVADLTLDPEAFPDTQLWQDEALLGRLQVTTLWGDEDGDGDFEDLYAFGGRSFSIWDSSGELVWDSGNDFETITAARYGIDFNNDNAEADPDSRSDAKGPEPEALAVGTVGDSTYAFVGLERTGGIVVYDVTTPDEPVFVAYENNRDMTIDPADETGPDAGDLGPETLLFLTAAQSPVPDTPLLMVAHEVSGTVTVYSIAVAE